MMSLSECKSDASIAFFMALFTRFGFGFGFSFGFGLVLTRFGVLWKTPYNFIGQLPAVCKYITLFIAFHSALFMPK